MEDFLSDDDYYDSGRDSLDGLENEDCGPQWVPSKGPTCKVKYFFALLLLFVIEIVIFVFDSFEAIGKMVSFFFFG